MLLHQTRPERVFPHLEAAMADYFTQFSCIFDVGSAKNAARAADILVQVEAEIDEEDGNNVGFSMMLDPQTGPGALWIHSKESGEPEHVIKFALRCAEAMNLIGVWGFTWGLSCSKPRLDGFGGGAHVLDLGKRETIAWIDCSNLVIEHTTPSSNSSIPDFPDASVMTTDDAEVLALVAGKGGAS